MVNQRPGAGLFTVIVLGLIAGLVGGILGALVVLRFANNRMTQTIPIPFAITMLRPSPTPTVQQIPPTATVTSLPPPTVTPEPNVDELTIEVVRRNQGSVVTVVSLPEASTEPAGVGLKALGSGIVWDDGGHIVTNEHIVRGAAGLRVILPNGAETTATLVGMDQLTDLAVVKVEDSDLSPAKFGDSLSLQPGQRVIAIGSALGGFRNTVTVGVVSGLGRQIVPKDEAYALENLIQTDAAINRGNSGGPLLNMRGEVIGVNTILVRQERDSEEIVEGIGFAIPSDTVQQIVPQLLARGRVPRPYLGVEPLMVDPQVKATYALTVDHGARVENVVANSPAERAGLRHGDVILAVNGEPINEDHPFINAVMRHRIGETIELLINRVGEELTLTITLEEGPGS